MRKLGAEFQGQLDTYVNLEPPPPKQAAKPESIAAAEPAPAQPTTYAPLHPPVPEHGAEPQAAAPIEEPKPSVETERVPHPPQVIDSGQTIPRQKPAPQPESP
jgi:hypothetical protein